MSEKGPLCALYVRKCVKYNKKIRIYICKLQNHSCNLQIISQIRFFCNYRFTDVNLFLTYEIVKN